MMSDRTGAADLGPPPRRTAMTGRGRSMFLLVVLFPLLPMAFTLSPAQPMYRQLAELKAHGVVVAGTVADKFVSSGKSSRGYLVCRYHAEGIVDTANGGVSDDAYNEARIGDACVVTYLPGDPHHGRYGRITDGMVKSPQRMDAQAFLLFGLFDAVLLGLVALGYRWEQRLLADGAVVDASVTSSGPAPKSAGVRVQYTFTVDGRAYQGIGTIPGGSVGAHIAVLYDRAKPSSNIAVNAMTLVRLA